MGMIQNLPNYHHKTISQKNCLQALFEEKTLFNSISSIQLGEQ